MTPFFFSAGQMIKITSLNVSQSWFSTVIMQRLNAKNAILTYNLQNHFCDTQKFWTIHHRLNTVKLNIVLTAF